MARLPDGHRLVLGPGAAIVVQHRLAGGVVGLLVAGRRLLVRELVVLGLVLRNWLLRGQAVRLLAGLNHLMRLLVLRVVKPLVVVAGRQLPGHRLLLILVDRLLRVADQSRRALRILQLLRRRWRRRLLRNWLVILLLRVVHLRRRLAHHHLRLCLWGHGEWRVVLRLRVVLDHVSLLVANRLFVLAAQASAGLLRLPELVLLEMLSLLVPVCSRLQMKCIIT